MKRIHNQESQSSGHAISWIILDSYRFVQLEACNERVKSLFSHNKRKYNEYVFIILCSNCIVFKTLEELNEYFLNHSYCVGYAPSNKDAELFALVHKYLDAAKYPHLARWFNHMCSFTDKA